MSRGRPAAHVAGLHLAYEFGETGPLVPAALYVPAYAVPSVLPFFASTVSRAKTLGAVLSVALAASFVLQRRAFASVWCFFAAIISAIIVAALREDYRRTLQTS